MRSKYSRGGNSSIVARHRLRRRHVTRVTVPVWLVCVPAAPGLWLQRFIRREYLSPVWQAKPFQCRSVEVEIAPPTEGPVLLIISQCADRKTPLMR